MPFWLKICIAAGILLILVLLYLINPAESKIVPPCVFNDLTGFYCPGCGTLRATHALLHGDIGEAVTKNPLLFVIFPVLGILAFNKKWLYHSYTAWSTLIVIILFWALRNIPVWPCTLLAPH
jgi:hypothetical protein